MTIATATGPQAPFPLSARDLSANDADERALAVIDRHDALEAYRAFDDGTLAEAPHALAAYIAHHCYECM